MKSITENIPFPLAILQTVLQWVSQYFYSKLLDKDPHNPWVKLDKMLDFNPIEVACSNYSKRVSGLGITHTVPKLARVLFVKTYLTLSLRETEQAIRYDVAIRRFVGYGLFDDVPDHTTIERFEQWVALNHPRLYFDTVLKQIEGKQPAKQTVQYGDSYAMRANATPQGIVQKIRACCRKLERTIGEDDAFKSAKFPREQLYGKEDEKLTFLMNNAERARRLTDTVKGAVWLVLWVKDQTPGWRSQTRMH